MGILMVSLKDSIFLSNEEKFVKWVDEFREGHGSILDELIKGLDDIESLGYSKKFIKSFSDGPMNPFFDRNYDFNYMVKIFSKEAWQIRKYKDRIRLKNIAYLNLINWHYRYGRWGIIFGIFYKYEMSFIQYDIFVILYLFLERLYYARTDGLLGFEDVLNIYFSGLDESLLWGLDRFDEIESPEPTVEFFKKLGKVDSNDKNVNEFFYKSRMTIRTAETRVYGGCGFFGKTESKFLSLLAACSAVKHDRKELTTDDYLTAYKTYYKLLKTDITQYKAKPEVLMQLGLETFDTQEGYLVCDKCNRYYQLQPGESPDDFSDTCECGGHLEYRKEII